MPPAIEAPLGPPTSAMNVARYLVFLAGSEKNGPAQEPDCLTHMRLQKLLYFVQGWSLGLTGGPIFEDRIEAWRFGPVVPSVYQAFKRYGAGPIAEEEGSFECLSEQHKAFVRRCWETYKQYGPIGLVELSHQEEPWKEARGSMAPDATSDSEISVESMRRSFRERAANG